MTAPTVSVIIPTFNDSLYVRDTLRSVVNQTYENLEVIVTDDGSTDDTLAIVENERSSTLREIRVLRAEQNTGIPANFNRGLNAASGALIAWLGGDDEMAPDKIRRQVVELERRPDAVGCCHDAEIFRSPSNEVIGRFSDVFNGGRRLREGGVELLLDPTYFILPSTMMVRREACPENGFDERLRISSDWLFDIETFRRGSCIVMDEVLGRYRRHERNVTGSLEAARLALEEGLIVLSVVEARYPELQRLVARRRTALLLGEARRQYIKREFRAASRFGRAAFGDGGMVRGASVAARLAALMLRRRRLGISAGLDGVTS